MIVVTVLVNGGTVGHLLERWHLKKKSKPSSRHDHQPLLLDGAQSDLLPCDASALSPPPPGPDEGSCEDTALLCRREQGLGSHARSNAPLWLRGLGASLPANGHGSCGGGGSPHGGRGVTARDGDGGPGPPPAGQPASDGGSSALTEGAAVLPAVDRASQKLRRWLCRAAGGLPEGSRSLAGSSAMTSTGRRSRLQRMREFAR